MFSLVLRCLTYKITIVRIRAFTLMMVFEQTGYFTTQKAEKHALLSDGCMISDIRSSFIYIYIYIYIYVTKSMKPVIFLRALNGFASPNFVWTIAPFIC